MGWDSQRNRYCSRFLTQIQAVVRYNVPWRLRSRLGYICLICKASCCFWWWILLEECLGVLLSMVRGLGSPFFSPSLGINGDLYIFPILLFAFLFTTEKKITKITKEVDIYQTTYQKKKLIYIKHESKKKLIYVKQSIIILLIYRSSMGS